MGNRNTLQLYLELLNNILQDLQLDEDFSRNTREEANRVSAYINQMQGDAPQCEQLERKLSTLLNEDEHFFDDYIQITDKTSQELADVDVMIHELQEKLNECSRIFNQNITGICNRANNPPEFIEGDENRTRLFKNALKYQIFHAIREELIKFLIHQRIIPAFGFPIDVVTFYAGTGVSLERDIFTAINEFIPQSEITIGHLKYSVDALARDYMGNNELFEAIHLYTCPYCHSIFENSINNSCPICHMEFAAIEENLLNAEAEYLPENNQGNNQRLTPSFIRYVRPYGYLSFSPAVDAKSSKKGMIWTSPQDPMLIMPYQGFQTIQNNQGQPAPAQFRLLRPEDNVTLICVNGGQYKSHHRHLGYLLDKHTGAIVSKSPNQAENENWKTKHPDYMCTELACKTYASVWICAIPTENYGEIGFDQSIQNLLLNAILIEVTDFLSLDSRAIKGTIRKQERTVLFCIYDTSGNAQYLKEIDANNITILRNAMRRLINGRTFEGRYDSLINYATERNLNGLSEDDFVMAADWAERYLYQLTEGCYQTWIIDEQPYGIEPVNNDILFNSNGQPIEILCDKINNHDFEQNSKLFNFLRSLNRGHVKIFVNSESADSDAVRDYLHNKMYQTSQSFQNVIFAEVNFETTGVRAKYDQGVRLKVGQNWFAYIPERNTTANSHTTSNIFDDYFDSANLYKLMNFTYTLPDSAIQINKEIPMAIQPFFSKKGQKFADLSADMIWNNFNFSTNREITHIKIEDPYFTVPGTWKTLQMLLCSKRLKLADNIEIDIHTIDPASKDNGNKKWIYDNTSIDKIRCTLAHCELKIDKAQSFAEWLKTRISSNNADISITYDANDIHDRFTYITYIENNTRNEVKIILGKGYDMLDYYDCGQNISILDGHQVYPVEGNTHNERLIEENAHYTQELTFAIANL